MNKKKEFKLSLVERIYNLRPKVSLGQGQTKGSRFNSDQWVYDCVVGAVLVGLKNPSDIPVLDPAIGLKLDKNMVISGQYDELIKNILYRLATIDHYHENSVAYH